MTDEKKVNVICNLTALAALVVLVMASFRHAGFVPVGTIEFSLGFVLAAVTTFSRRNKDRQHIAQIEDQNLRYLQAVNGMANVSLEILKAARK